MIRVSGAVLGISLLASVFVLPRAARAAPAQASEALELREEVARQATLLTQLQAQLDRLQNQSAVRLSGYGQVDWVAYHQASQAEVNPATGLPLNQHRFVLRRSRLRAHFDKGWVSASLEIDANTVTGLQLRPVNAELTIHGPVDTTGTFPSFALSAGLMKIPFGFEVPEAETHRPFLERSTAMRALFPGAYDLGVRATGRYRFLELVIAVMNGHPIGDKVFPALAPSPSKELICHLGTFLKLTPISELEFGVSFDTGSGFHQGTPTTKDQLVWRDDNGDGTVSATEVQVLAGTSATPSQRFNRFAVGADARLTLRFAEHASLALRAEVVRANNLDRGLELANPVGAGYTLREFGFHVGAFQEVTRYGFLGVRYDSYDPDQDAHEQRAQSVVVTDRSYRSLSLLAGLRFDTAKLVAQYDKNWNALGRTAAGAPTTRKSDALTVRVQAEF